MGHYWGRRGEITGQFLVIVCLQANNIASIIVAAQVTPLPPPVLLPPSLLFPLCSLLSFSLLLPFSFSLLFGLPLLTSQVMDDFLLFLFGHTYAVRFVPPYKWMDVTVETDKLFDQEEWVLSLGYVLCTVICIPFGVCREGKFYPGQKKTFKLILVGDKVEMKKEQRSK
jgi:hypothetical protein